MKTKSLLVFFSILFISNMLYSQKSKTSADTVVILPHLPPLSQANTSSCWSFAATSLFEAEHLRLYKDTINLSEQWFAYWDFMDKAFLFTSNKKGEKPPIGSELNSVSERIIVYGAVPFEAFKGNKQKNLSYNYDEMYEKYINEVHKQATKGVYNKTEIQKILISTMGLTPVAFKWKGKKYTPKTFYSEVLKVNSNDYFSFMSDASKTFNQKGELVEGDNWWNSDDYYNLPMNKFMEALKEALIGGYTVALCGDVSEKEYMMNGRSIFKNDSRISNIDSVRVSLHNLGLTTNDHCWHVVGYEIKNGEWWFLIKDSSYFDSKDSYHNIHESYVRLKAMSMMMHKYAARKIVDSIIK